VDKATERCIEILEKLNQFNGFGCLLWHIDVWDERVFPGRIKVYINLLNWLSKKSVWVASPGEIAQWWLNRIKDVRDSRDS
jgi:hypothetical protein